jgi:hypothetical protein
VLDIVKREVRRVCADKSRRVGYHNLAACSILHSVSTSKVRAARLTSYRRCYLGRLAVDRVLHTEDSARKTAM